MDTKIIDLLQSKLINYLPFGIFFSLKTTVFVKFS